MAEWSATAVRRSQSLAPAFAVVVPSVRFGNLHPLPVYSGGMSSTAPSEIEADVASTVIGWRLRRR